MKKIDQFLLERYPSIWNTKIVWMLIICLPLHLFFFMLGWTSLNEEKLKDYYYTWESDYVGIILLLNFIISILLIVGWLVMLFKHNSFKNFYPSSSVKLFGQFVQYFLILFCSISFVISYVLGVKSNVNINYSDDYIQEISEIYSSELAQSNDDMYYFAGNLIRIKEAEINLIVLGHIPWVFFIAVLIFCFRVTNLRSLLFTIVFSGVLSLILGIFAFLIVLGGGGDEEGVFWLYILTAFSIIIGSVILLGGIRKLFSAILINFSLLYFVPAVFGVVGLTTDFAIFDSDYVAMNYLVFALGFVFIFLYTHILHKWRALPE